MSISIRIRDTEACERQPLLDWDTVWVQRLDAQGGFGDWVLATGEDQKEQRGGLRARSALHTATMLALFTDRRLAPDEGDPPDGTGDRRGWWGDAIRLPGEPAETPLGSLLWTLARAPLSDETAARAREMAEEALATLVEQGAVARTEVEAGADPLAGRLELVVRHFSHDGARAYEQRFGVLWDQMRAPAQMNYGEQGVFA